MTKLLFPVLFLIGAYFLWHTANEQNQIDDDTIPLKPEELYLLDRFGPGTESFIKNKNKLIEQVRFSVSLRHSGFEGEWKFQGPGNIGARVSALAVYQKNPEVMVAGFSNGGVYKTVDGGQEWLPVFDQESNLAIGAIAIHPDNPSIIYVGTGDPDIPGNVFTGNGIYKSVNGGWTWTHLGLSETRIINEIIIDPENSENIYAAAMGNPFTRSNHRGLYKSSNGGRDWKQVLFVNQESGISDMAFKPNDPKTIYAASWNRVRNDSGSVVQGFGSRIYKSIDAGESWKLIQNGISGNIFGRIALGVSDAQPEWIYARIVSENSQFCNGGQQFSQLYFSDNAGELWTKREILFDESNIPCDALGGFGWYFGRMAVNPKNAEEIWILGVDLWKSSDGGTLWSLASPPWFTYEVHADKHELEFLPNGDFVLGTDGGLYQYVNELELWRDIENIPTTQYYRVAYNPHRPDWYYGGAQDNGTSGGNALQFNEWDRIFGGDGFLPLFHPVDSLVFWVLTQNGGLSQTQDGGFSYERFTNGLRGSKNWDMPYVMSPHDPDILYAGAQRLYINRNAYVPDWDSISSNLAINGPYKTAATPTITCLDESPLSAGTLIVGSNSGNIWISVNQGLEWKNVSTSLPPALITSVKCSQVNSDWFYASSTSYRNDVLKSYIFLSKDRGNTWTDITGGALVDIPVFDLQFFKKNSDDALAAATLTGVYARVDGTQDWKRLGINMPVIPVNDLTLNESKNELVAGTFARGIMSFPIDQITSGPSSTAAVDKSNDLFVFPNPGTGRFHIKSQQKIQSAISVFTVRGELLKIVPMLNQNSSGCVLDLSDLPNGVYLIHYRTEDRWQSQKIDIRGK